MDRPAEGWIVAAVWRTRLRARTAVTIWAIAMILCTAPLAHAEVPKAVAKKVDAARKKASDELVKLSKWCAARKAYEAAREELELAIAVAADPKKPSRELAKLTAKEDDPKEGVEDELEARREKAHTSCVDRLHGVADAALAADSPEGFDDVVRLLIDVFPDADTTERYELSWFEPYARWVREEDRALLDAGGERVDGQWLDAEAVAVLDAKHATWETRWKLSNGTFRVETAKPLRMANTFLAHATAFRRWFVAEHGDVWELRAHDVELPILVTSNQAEFARVYAEHREGTPVHVLGFYLNGAAGSPVLMTFEPVVSGEPRMVSEFQFLQGVLYHELTHQLGFEYSAFAATGSARAKPHYWAVEALARHCQWMRPAKWGWRHIHPYNVEGFDGARAYSPLSWVKDNLSSLVPIDEFMTTPPAPWPAVPYSKAGIEQGAAVAFFFLTYDHGCYREAFLEFVQEVHRGEAAEDSLTRRLGGVTMADLQEQFSRFVKRIRIDR